MLIAVTGMNRGDEGKGRIIDLPAESADAVVRYQGGNNAGHPVPPKLLKNVVKCKNPRCITSIEPECEHYFKMSPSGRYRCLYCNQEIPVKI